MIVEIMKGNYSGRELILMILIMLFALTISFSVHEFMHAFAATLFGDDTPGYMGRLTLNPAAHLDPIGTLCLLFVGFGWGKPVLYNPNKLTRFKSKRFMRIMVSLAGIIGNFIVGLIASIIIVFIARFAGESFIFSNAGAALISTLFYTRLFSVGLMGFNLLPIPPLDGFRVIEEILPLKIKYSDGWKKFVYYGNRVLFVIVILGSMTGIHLLNGLMNAIEFPFNLAIDSICALIARLIA